MRYMIMHKHDPHTEAGEKPPMELIAKSGAFIGEHAQKGNPSAHAKRLVFTSNKLAVIDGPFAEAKELIGGFAILRVPSIEVAIAECRRYAEILGGTLEIDVRPLEEPDAAA